MIREDNVRCVGCGACAAACPTHCIEIQISPSGEYRPVIQKDRCVGCDRCTKVCMLENQNVAHWHFGRAYYGWRRDGDVMESTSGGIAAVLADHVVATGGVVVGAVLEPDQGVVRHRLVEAQDALKTLQGSKYVESYLADIYPQVKAKLQTGQTILFTGVPCQIFALKSFLGQDYPNLITVEVLCLGAPRVGVFKKYLEHIQKKYGALRAFNFRSKQFGWQNVSYAIELERGEIREKLGKNVYHLMFGYHNSIRQSCFTCSCRSYERHADISLGDFWGVEKYYPNVDRAKGVSAVFVNTEKGDKLLKAVRDRIELFDCREEEILEKNLWQVRNFEKPENQAQFESDYRKMSTERFFAKYSFLYKVWFKIVRKIKSVLR